MPINYKRWSLFGVGFLTLMVIALIGLRLYLPIWLKDKLNEELSNMNGYRGKIQDVEVHLYRGAYSIHALEIKKLNSGIPVPFLTVEIIDFSIDWKSLLHGRVVSKIYTEKAVINFAVNPQGTQSQDGTEVDWTAQLKKLMPIDINEAVIHDSKVFYRNFSTSPQVNLSIYHLNGTITNIRNVVDKNNPMPSSVHFTGNSIGDGKLQFNGNMNILSVMPEIAFMLKLEKVNLPALNNYFQAFAFIDVKKGDFDLYSEMSIHKGIVRGYAKPIASHISLIDLHKESNPVKLLWEGLVSVVIEIFTNHHSDQFATRIPITGDLNDVQTGTWSAIVGIVKNAFIQGLKKGVDGDLKIVPTRPNN